MAEWYKKSFRRTLLDMHIEDWDESFLSKYDPEEYFHALQRARITSPMIYVQSHVGLCYWPTKSGIMHKAFTGKEDTVKHLFDLCHKAGMDVILYYSVIFNNREYDRHEEWRMLDLNGQGSRENGVRYGLCCPNSPGYRAFVLEQIEEFSSYFDFEGVFFDMTFWPEVCYCSSCRKRWEEEVGGEMPAVVDWNDPDWLQFDRKRQEWLGEFAQLITDKAKECKPGISVEHQYSASMHYWRFGNNENVSLASDYIGTDLYGGIKQQSFACKAWYHLTKNQPFQYMTSRCYPSLNEHTTSKSYDQIKQCISMTYLHHGASFLIDAIDPVGTFDHRVYEVIGDIYADMEVYEKYLTRGTLDYDICLYYNLNGKADIEAGKIPVMDHRLDRGNPEGGTMPHQEALLGACESLVKHHIPFGVMNNWKLGEMKKHKVLVLPDVPMMGKLEVDAVKEYLKGGGNVYMSGHSAPELLEEVCGLKWLKYTQETITYMQPTKEDTFLKKYFTAKHPLAMKEKAVITSGKVKGIVKATLTLPYTVPVKFTEICPSEIKEDEYIDKNSPSYRFASIHANPPGIETAYPALVESTYGKGKLIWSAVPVEKADRYQHSNIFSDIVKYLAEGDLKFEAEASESLELVMFDAPEYHQKLLGAVETRQAFQIPRTRDSIFYIRSETTPKKIIRLPDDVEIPFQWDGGKIAVNCDCIHIFTMLVIQY